MRGRGKGWRPGEPPAGARAEDGKRRRRAAGDGGRSPRAERPVQDRRYGDDAGEREESRLERGAGARSRVAPARAASRSAASDEHRLVERMEEHVGALLEAVGEDPRREGLLKTPGRVARALRELTRGYRQDVDEILNQAFFTERYDSMVIVKDIELYSLCEHHVLPFYGKCHVAYLPNSKILGLSKIARLVDVFARRLQVQERLTNEIAETLMRALEPKGVGVVVEARHLCMTMRGVEKQHSVAITSAMLGSFRKDVATRTEFLNLIRPERE